MWREKKRKEKDITRPRHFRENKFSLAYRFVRFIYILYIHISSIQQLCSRHIESNISLADTIVVPIPR